MGGACNPEVLIAIPGKDFSHVIQTQAITGPTLVPKTLLTYYVPGDGLRFTVSEAGNQLGAVEISGDDIHPSGLEGDLPLLNPVTGGDGAGFVQIKIVPLG